MASAGNLVTKQNIIDDFFATVIAPAPRANAWHKTNFPTIDTAFSGYWGTFDHRISVTAYSIIGATNADGTVVDVLVEPTTGMSAPSQAELSTANITASNIVSVLRNYAYSTTRVRVVRAGIYYNTITTPSNGVYNEQTNYAYLNDNYLRSQPLNVVGPVVNETIIATQLNSFYSSLRSAANTDTYNDIVDLRICHQSCHYSCHSSRGRR